MINGDECERVGNCETKPEPAVFRNGLPLAFLAAQLDLKTAKSPKKPNPYLAVHNGTVCCTVFADLVPRLIRVFLLVRACRKYGSVA